MQFSGAARLQRQRDALADANTAVLPLMRARRPQAIMLQTGADGLEEDPLARLSLSNNAHWSRGRGGARISRRG